MTSKAMATRVVAPEPVSAIPQAQPNPDYLIQTAHLFDVFAWSSYHGFNAPIAKLLDEIIAHRLTKGKTVRNRNKCRSHLKTTVINLFTAHEMSTNPYVGVSKNKSDYQKNSRNWQIFLSYDHLIPVINDLDKLGYLEQVLGSEGKHLRTRIKATSKLIDLLYDPQFSIKSKISESGLLSLTNPHPEAKYDLITLKNEDGDKIDYKATKPIRLMKAHIDQVNAKLKQSLITLKMTDEQFNAMEDQLTSEKDLTKRTVNFTNNHIYRVFNNSSFELGGRFYGGWWQNVPSQYRKYIEINHKPTVEIDYSSHHIRILYDQEGLSAPEDAYEISGYDKDSLKEIMLIMINCRSKRQAMKKLEHMDEIEPDIAKTMAQLLIEKHQPIRRYFYSGIGLSLMYKDSIIAEQVMLEMLKRGATVLPVHDSFIVRNSYEQELREVMEAEYQKLHQNQPKAKLNQTVLEEIHERKATADEISLVEADDLESIMKDIATNHKKFLSLWGIVSW